MACYKTLRCIQCAYNLRGLKSDGKCPECATPILLSIRASERRYPSWRSLVWCLVVAYGLALLYATIVTQGHPGLFALLEIPGRDPAWNMAFFFVVTGIVGILLWRAQAAWLPKRWWRRAICLIVLASLMTMYCVLLERNKMEGGERFPVLAMYLVFCWPLPLFLGLLACWGWRRLEERELFS